MVKINLVIKFWVWNTLGFGCADQIHLETIIIILLYYLVIFWLTRILFHLGLRGSLLIYFCDHKGKSGDRNKV